MVLSLFTSLSAIDGDIIYNSTVCGRDGLTNGSDIVLVINNIKLINVRETDWIKGWFKAWLSLKFCQELLLFYGYRYHKIKKVFLQIRPVRFPDKTKSKLFECSFLHTKNHRIFLQVKFTIFNI